jgi:hypothetical protein
MPGSSEPLPVLDFCRLLLCQCGIGHWVNSASAPTVVTIFIVCSGAILLEIWSFVTSFIVKELVL